MLDLAKQFIRRSLRNRGYLIGKAPRGPFPRIPLFDLAIAALESLNGPALRFVQVGANDGVMGDSISRYALHRPWRGILIEPQPEVMVRLKENYAAASDRMIFENVAIGTAKDGELVLWRANINDAKSHFASTVASANREAVAKQLHAGVAELERIAVPMLTLDTLLAKHGWDRFDLLLIDTEGMDLDVLRSIALDRHLPALIQFEHGHLSPSQIDAAFDLLANAGYALHFGGWFSDSLAMHSDLLARLDPRQ
jgi:FkbM family methyltransferase